MLLTVALAPSASACLTPMAPITASVESLGPNASGLEQLQVHVEGFELVDLSNTGVGCTIALGTESQIVGPPLWAIQHRMIATALTIVDPASGNENEKFLLNPSLTVDLLGEALGQGGFSWPISIAFVPLTITQTSAAAKDLPKGPVELIFDVLVKPSSSIFDAVADIEGFGTVVSDYSVTYAGITYLLWSSSPFSTEISAVYGP